MARRAPAPSAGAGRARCLLAGRWRRSRAAAPRMITEFGEERQRRLVLDYFGGDCAAAAVAAHADLRLAGVCRRFRPRPAPFPHPRLVRQQHPGDRAVEHGPALPGAARLSLRAADVAGLCDEPAGGDGVAARRRRCGDVALYARLSAGLRADPGRRRRGGRRDRPPLVLPDPAGHPRAGAGIRRRDHGAFRRRSWSISTTRPVRPKATSCFGPGASMPWPRAGASPTTGPISRSTRRSGRWRTRSTRSPAAAAASRSM